LYLFPFLPIGDSTEPTRRSTMPRNNEPELVAVSLLDFMGRNQAVKVEDREILEQLDRLSAQLGRTATRNLGTIATLALNEIPAATPRSYFQLMLELIEEDHLREFAAEFSVATMRMDRSLVAVRRLYRSWKHHFQVRGWLSGFCQIRPLLVDSLE